MQPSLDLLEKYNVPVPRYTSYPTVPFWDEHIAFNEWQQVLQQQFTACNSTTGISLYLHLPFCEKLCTYCGCNKKITNNHSVEEEYMQAILKEWQLYLQVFKQQPVIRELHIGGGTPTFFSPENLGRLLDGIFAQATIHPQHEFSFEGHPNNTTLQHLQTLYNKGFRRVSFGVQDHDARVQQVINRIQPFENVARATAMARAVGYTSVNFDLIYGLPLQTTESMATTIAQTLTLQPDRIAFYSYAHVPWTSRGQRLFDEHDLPGTSVKMQLYQMGKSLFTAHGYNDIGMDHFALPGDDLFIARNQERLHRNFMGYTTQHTGLLLGLGVSSISDAGIAFAQNEKKLQDYYTAIDHNRLPVVKGYFLTEEDVVFRKQILDISCNSTTILPHDYLGLLRDWVIPALLPLEKDGLIVLADDTLTVTKMGENFIRNICSAFDLHLQRKTGVTNTNQYSKAI
jgi:oxygen-independent coproporphyrinogen III oxidase